MHASLTSVEISKSSFKNVHVAITKNVRVGSTKYHAATLCENWAYFWNKTEYSTCFAF